MDQPNPGDTPSPRRGLRWWPAILILVLGSGLLIALRADSSASFQQRNLRTLTVVLSTGLLLFLWWLTLSRSPWKQRLAIAALALGLIGGVALLFRIRGVTGDLVPIVEFRWTRHSSETLPPANRSGATPAVSSARPDASLDFPQFLGPHRTAILEAPALARDWTLSPPQVVWRQPVGAAWSGWAIVGGRALTQEQRGDDECVTCYDLRTGRLIWSRGDAAHYHTTIAGEGPRCTPTVVSNRVFTLGATGILNCLDLATGQKIWTRKISEDAHATMPEWGYAGSPLEVDGNVVVIAGGNPDHSLLAYRKDTGELAWSGGSASAGYGSPFLATLAGVRQVLVFHSRTITGQDARSGRVLWEFPWGIGQPQVSVPVVVGTNRVLFSSGYGVGSVMLEISARPEGSLAAGVVWKSGKLKAKFAPLVQRDGFVYGLDDGILTCLDLATGAPRWKEGRYGHGQGLLVRDLYLLMAENGELVLLQPTPDAPHELQRFRVFNAKTWNPIALAGDLLLCRNDQEAACLRLPVERTGP